VASSRTDFADFADAPEPAPAAFSPVPGGANLDGNAPAVTGRPYTKWYNVHERYDLNDFRAEGLILGCIVIVLIVHVFGARMNRSKARAWIKANAKPMTNEFALVGFRGVPPSAAGKDNDELLQELEATNPADMLKEKSLFEFASYATGRQNVAFMDVKLTLLKRFNPFMTIIESGMGFFFESMGSPEDIMEATLYPFDGKEAQTVPGLPGAAEIRTKDSKSTYDGFVWAIVNKERMKQLREDRYDLSITFTKDHGKLPSWLTVMSESAEITDALLTPELIKAAEAAGDDLDYLIVTDQPIDKPKT